MDKGSGTSPLRVFSVFYVSLMAICAELCLASMLSLKSFSHMVYVVISFALLGYGLGSNVFLLFGDRLRLADLDLIAGISLLAVSAFTFAAVWFLPSIPINFTLIYEAGAILSLTLLYGLVALPFAGVGFLISLLFSSALQETRKLYFWDLVGAGLGAVAFFPLIAGLGPIRTLLLFSLVGLVPAAIYIGIGTRLRKSLIAGTLGLALLELLAASGPEPVYRVDRALGWEYIPGRFNAGQFEETWRAWHPMGRTDLHRMTDPEARRWLRGPKGGPVTFELPVSPDPEFSFFSNSYRAGTPVFDLSDESVRKNGTKVTPFTTTIETPYVLLDKPKVLVIGCGGGRDLYTAGIHGATDIVGAEINPGTYQAMAPGGVAYEYSGRVYTSNGARVFNIDGRHLVKNEPPESRDLVILSGVDTFAALSTGAFAFAENYLYTQEAIVDYLRILKPGGMINFNRWLEDDAQPRETLRLLLMAMDALRSIGVKDPTKHIVVAGVDHWGVILIKRTPFEPAEERKLVDYFAGHRLRPIYTPSLTKPPEKVNPLDRGAAAFREGKEKEFIEQYWADVSVVHDDNPFFYKYYRFSLKDTTAHHHPGMGSTAFHVQGVIVVQSVVFILLFIFAPLVVFRKKAEPLLPKGLKIPFVLYFAALGTGFIFIEIALMQRFTLALGSPIHSISVSLSTILVATGVGSLLSGRFRAWAGTDTRMIQILGVLVAAYLAGMVLGGTEILNALVRMSFPVRVGCSVLLLAPVGICLGVFFPAGLLLIGDRSSQAVAWAWGINSGFTVLGSTVTILIAQFLGFRVVLLSAAALYLAAPLAYRWMSSGLRRASP